MGPTTTMGDGTGQRRRRRNRLATAAAALVATSGLLGAGASASVARVSASAAPGPGPTPGTAVPGTYIVQAGGVDAATEVVRAVGGNVIAPLPIVGGVEAILAGAEVSRIRDRHLGAVTRDVTLQPLGLDFGGIPAAAQLSRMDLPGWSPTTGSGIGVALLDTGVTPTPGLNSSRLVDSPDFSGSGSLTDGYGHGTFMAGLIAGNGDAGPGAVPGVAPGISLVSVKVGANDGSTTLVDIIEGIAWVVTHRQKYGIKVMSVSFGADFSGSPADNPLDAAVEVAWDAGITVVAAAGNGGPGSVTSPGDDPWVLTVGAETASGPYTAPSWSGSSATKPDVLAPGVSVVSLRDPGSVIDQHNPAARVGQYYFVGSGTSMATALTAGAVAILAADHRQATPDQLKAAVLAGQGAALSGPAGPIDVAASDALDPAGLPVQGRPDPLIDRAGPGGPVSWWSVQWDSVHWDSVHWDTSSWSDQSWGS